MGSGHESSGSPVGCSRNDLSAEVRCKHSPDLAAKCRRHARQLVTNRRQQTPERSIQPNQREVGYFESFLWRVRRWMPRNLAASETLPPPAALLLPATFERIAMLDFDL
jgi:hypothetical protein